MKFESKAHLAQELIKGKRFTNNGEFVIYYDPTHVNPFRCNSGEMSHIWDAYYLDIWEEVKPKHVHQDLINSYKKGQAWQYKGATKNTSFWSDSIDDEGDWCEPSWLSSVQYRLHPHNDLIQAHRNGAVIEYLTEDGWVETTNPTWNEDTQYRIKPATKIVYEWMFKSRYSNSWEIESFLFSEEEAKEHFKEHAYCKTGREFEVEA
jgi:hypothetical protein